MTMRTDTIVDDYLTALEEVTRSLPRPAIQQAVGILYECWVRGGTVFTLGNGGSASTASHLACDLAKATALPGRRRLKALALVDNVPLVSAWTNDSGFGSVFAEQLEPWLRAEDVLVALSVHGGSGEGDAGPWSQNLGRALALARSRGARVIGLSGFGGGRLGDEADVCIVVPAGEEPLGTPVVESLHVAVHHLLCVALRQRIADAGPDGPDGRRDCGYLPGHSQPG
ncbi:MAG: SIS domain-containing protein [Dehalococcoidia bacterium]|nr:SIS domain-containing protein [Dehalococcoidia bacterium]